MIALIFKHEQNTGQIWAILRDATKLLYLHIQKNTIMNDKEFEKLWQECKESDKKREEAYNALSEAEKKRLSDKYSDAFYDRISDDPTGGSDED